MTFHVPLTEPLTNTYWLGIAIHHAKLENADRFSAYKGRDLSKHNQLKRLWWCCIIRDETMALGVRRSLFISSPSFYELWPRLTDEDLKDEIERSFVNSPAVKLKLIQSVSTLSSLCTVLTNIIQLLYPAHGVHTTGDHLHLLKRIYTYTDELNEWHDEMVCNIEPRHQQDKNFKIVTLFNSILNIYFQ